MILNLTTDVVFLGTQVTIQ